MEAGPPAVIAAARRHLRLGGERKISSLCWRGVRPCRGVNSHRIKPDWVNIYRTRSLLQNVDEQVKTLGDYLGILKRRKWQLIVPAVLLSIVAVPTALFIPAVYRASATILIEQQEIPSDLVRTTVTGFADQRIQVISQRVMTTRNLSAIIERYNLYPELRRKSSVNAAVEQMRKAIDREMISADVVDPRGGRAEQASIAFSLSYESESAQLAQKVTNDLVSLYLNENIEQRQAAVEETTAFFAGEAKKLGEQIATLEGQLATFKEAHRDNLPEFAALNRELMGRTEERLRDNAQAARTLEEQKNYLELELAKLSPTLSFSAPTGASAQTPEARLQELETRYVSIAARYSGDHPDRVQIEREIAALREQVGQSDSIVIQGRLADLKDQLAVLRKRYSETHPDVAALKRSIAATEAELATAKRSSRNPQRKGTNAENPAYVQIRSKLDQTRLEVESLKQGRAALEQEVAQFEARISDAPKIEQAYKALVRDYDSATMKYKEVRDKEMQAQLAKSLETNRKGERFSLIEPPLVPEKPFKPNRPAILLLGLVLSIAGGAGNLAVREIMDKGLHGVRAVQTITGAPPLAVIPYIETQADRHRRVRRGWLWIAGVFAALAGGAAIVHLFLMPLDVLWFTLFHRIQVLMPTLTQPPS